MYYTIITTLSAPQISHFFITQVLLSCLLHYTVIYYTVITVLSAPQILHSYVLHSYYYVVCTTDITQLCITQVSLSCLRNRYYTVMYYTLITKVSAPKILHSYVLHIYYYVVCASDVLMFTVVTKLSLGPMSVYVHSCLWDRCLCMFTVVCGTDVCLCSQLSAHRCLLVFVVILKSSAGTISVDACSCYSVLVG